MLTDEQLNAMSREDLAALLRRASARHDVLAERDLVEVVRKELRDDLRAEGDDPDLANAAVVTFNVTEADDGFFFSPDSAEVSLSDGETFDVDFSSEGPDTVGGFLAGFSHEAGRGSTLTVDLATGKVSYP